MTGRTPPWAHKQLSPWLALTHIYTEHTLTHTNTPTTTHWHTQTHTYTHIHLHTQIHLQRHIYIQIRSDTHLNCKHTYTFIYPQTHLYPETLVILFVLSIMFMFNSNVLVQSLFSCIRNKYLQNVTILWEWPLVWGFWDVFNSSRFSPS